MIRTIAVVIITAAVAVEAIVVGSREHESFQLQNLPASFVTKGRLHTERIVKIMSLHRSIALFTIHVSTTLPPLAEPLWPLY